MALSNPFLPKFHSIQSKEIPKISGNKPVPAMSIHSSAKNWSKILGDEALDKVCNRRMKRLKEAKNILTKLKQDDLSSESLRLIDGLQRLGIDYHFKEEVKSILESAYNKIYNQNQDLSQVTLGFRLLRQEGYYVAAADVFEKFMNKNGKFKQELGSDIRGLMGLYEASQLILPGENVLDEAELFSGEFLKSSVSNLADDQARIVSNTLKNPYHRTFTRSLVRNFLQEFHGGDLNDFSQTFLQLAQFDFNMLQSFHREEVAQVTKWWKEIGLSEELKFQRDKPLDWFMWPLACLNNPSLSAKRVDLSKIISILHLIQDVFEFFGTIDQLTRFANAVSRWEITNAEDLPDCMKICLEAIFEITNEIAHNMDKELRFNPRNSLQKAWVRLCNALLEDARCVGFGKFPKAEEYLKNTIETYGVNVVLVHTFFLLNEGITRETVDIVNGNPGIISSSATILRLWNDLTSAKFENGEGSYGSYMLCYMKENPGSSVNDARNHVMNMISETWKQLNWECLSPSNPFSSSFTKAALNVARLAPFICEFDNTTTLPSLQDEMKSMIFQRISV